MMACAEASPRTCGSRGHVDQRGRHDTTGVEAEDGDVGRGRSRQALAELPVASPNAVTMASTFWATAVVISPLMAALSPAVSITLTV